MKTTPYLQLMRPPNLLTAVADIWAGIALSGFFITGHQGSSALTVLLLSIASVALYAGGVIYNDVCDAELDKKERPERPIPSGRVSRDEALALAMVFFLIGFMVAMFTGLISGIIALGVALLAIAYNKWGKRNAVTGPLNMGLCRGGNLLLGISIIPTAIPHIWWVALVPVVYITAVTMISRGEIQGGSKPYLFVSTILYLFSMVAVLFIAVNMNRLWITLLFVILFGAMALPPLMTAIGDPAADRVGKAVKSGVLGLILLDAAWVAASAGIIWAILTALLLPVSFIIARKFAVT